MHSIKSIKSKPTKYLISFRGTLLKRKVRLARKSFHRKNMKIFLIFCMFLNYAMAASVLVPLAAVVRTPGDDTAIVESTRIKGNFAYSTVEGHAYKTITPVLGKIVAADVLQPTDYIYVRN